MATHGEETRVGLKWSDDTYRNDVNFVSSSVSGEANFMMSSTRLTIGGFTQAGVARSLIDMPSNSEKGLSHRFLWVFPKPLFGKFAALEEVDKTFTAEISEL